MSPDCLVDQCLEKSSCDSEYTLFDDRQETLDRMSEASRVRKPSRLMVVQLSESSINSLIEPSSGYANWLRVLMLRLMVRTPAANSLRLRPGYAMNSVCNFLGFTNFESYSQSHDLSKIIKDLDNLLVQWERTYGVEPCLPSNLRSNIDALSEVVGLTADERNLLAFAVLIHAEPVLEHCAELLGNDQSGYSIHRILAPVLGIPENLIQGALDKKATLASSGLLSIDIRGRHCLKGLLDLLTQTFSSRMVSPQSDIRSVIEGFVRPAKKTDLSLADFEYLSDWSDTVGKYLKDAFSTQRTGVNILIYGAPGTGKSQFSRVLADSLGADLLEISQTNLAGHAVTPIRRIRSFQIAQRFFGDQKTVLLFDEVEEIFEGRGVEQNDDEASVPQKSFFNALLENNHLPTIWIANSISNFDEAYLRRFDICFRMPNPTASVRQAMVDKVFGNLVSEPLRHRIASNDQITPAMLTQVARVSKTTAAGAVGNIEQTIRDLINEKLKAQGYCEISQTEPLGVGGSGFDPAAVNCQIDLETLEAGLQRTRAARICVFGPPGTGKTAFGKWLADALGMPHMVLRASDLLSIYVGGTEKAIANAFARAAREKAILQIDEVDSFLQDRSRSERNYEVVRVNEMLTQMESFQGIFIASTNLFEDLDEATLRRFDLNVKFDYMTPRAAARMFEMICSKLNLGSPDSLLLERVASLGCLTPGDFQQLFRRASLIRFGNNSELFVALHSALKLKKNADSKPIGFLRAA